MQTHGGNYYRIRHSTTASGQVSHGYVSADLTDHLNIFVGQSKPVTKAEELLRSSASPVGLTTVGFGGAAAQGNRVRIHFLARLVAPHLEANRRVVVGGQWSQLTHPLTHPVRLVGELLRG